MCLIYFSFSIVALSDTVLVVARNSSTRDRLDLSSAYCNRPRGATFFGGVVESIFQFNCLWLPNYVFHRFIYNALLPPWRWMVCCWTGDTLQYPKTQLARVSALINILYLYICLWNGELVSVFHQLASSVQCSSELKSFGTFSLTWSISNFVPLDATCRLDRTRWLFGERCLAKFGPQTH